MSVPKPLPSLEGLNGDFYRALSDGTLRFQRCSDCGHFRHPPRYRCASCGSAAAEWAASEGRGEVFTWTVTHQAMHPAFAEDVPYAVVVVELREGVRLVCGLRDLAPERLELGLPVEIVLERVSDEVLLPYARPANA